MTADPLTCKHLHEVVTGATFDRETGAWEGGQLLCLDCGTYPDPLEPDDDDDANDPDLARLLALDEVTK
jgi:hypothetical protein